MVCWAKCACCVYMLVFFFTSEDLVKGCKGVQTEAGIPLSLSYEDFCICSYLHCLSIYIELLIIAYIESFCFIHKT